MKWSGNFPFLFINRLKMTWDRQAYLWRDLDLRFVSFYKSNYIAEKICWMTTKPCSAKSAIMIISIQFTYIYVWYPTPFTIWWNYHSYLSPSVTYRPIMWSVGWRNGDVKGLYYISIFDNYAALWKCPMLILHLFDQKYRKNCSLILWNITI